MPIVTQMHLLITIEADADAKPMCSMMLTQIHTEADSDAADVRNDADSGL
ncbi:MAG: hypothetical protein ACLRZG_04975 [Streptococcus sp.]